MPTVTVTFVQATYVLETFVLFRNLTQFWQALIFLDQKLFGPKFCLTLTFVDLQTFFYPKFFWTQNFVDLRFCGPKIVFHTNFLGPNLFALFTDVSFSYFEFCLPPIFSPIFFFDPIFSHPVLFLRGYTYKLP